MEELRQQFSDYITEGNLEEALKVLSKAGPKSSNEIILTQARLSGLNQNIRLGIISHSDAQINRNQITQAIISIGENVFKDVDFTRKQNENNRDTNSSLITPKQDLEKIKKASKIYFSYSWGDDKSKEGLNREKHVDELFSLLEKDGYHVIRDKVHVGYGESIEKFMRDLGRNGLNLVFLSDKYFKSFYSMFELTEIDRNNLLEKDKFQKAILPIHVEDISFLDDLGKMRTYLEHWTSKLEEMSSLREDFKEDIDLEFQSRYSNIRKIKTSFIKLFGWLGDINASSVALLSENDFQVVKDAIDERLALLNQD